jgi:predicted AAA+ superfamily ATPase
MIPRRRLSEIEALLDHSPAVVLVGPRQAGKTTLAHEIAGARPSTYLDLESPADRARLAEPELYLGEHERELVVLDEVHRFPDLFQPLRGIIDRGRRRGLRSGRFLLLGSASIDLLKQSGETLAGRVSYAELDPFDVVEFAAASHSADLWLRGGFPESALAEGDEWSFRWRADFIRTYLERDVPQLGPRIPAETLRRFWTMLAHQQGGILNAARLAAGLGVDGKTVSRYLDLLVDLLLVRRLPPLHANTGKRLVKSPKVYVRDSGLVHALLGIADRQALLGHPVAGTSWEGHVLENILRCAPPDVEASFYRTAGGAEMDLVLSWPGGRRWAVEVKRTTAPRVERGLRAALHDLTPDHTFIVYAGDDRYPLGDRIDAISLLDLCRAVASS